MDVYLKRLELLYNIILNISKCENNYTSSLITLQKSLSLMINNYVSKNVDNPIINTIQIIQKYYENKSKNHQSKTELINQYVLKPIEDLLKEEKNNKYQEKINEEENIVKNIITKISKAQEKYFELMKSIEKNMMNYELMANNKEIVNKNNQLEKLKNKINENIKDTKNEENNYKDLINSGNEITLKFFYYMNKIRKKVDNYIRFEDDLIIQFNNILVDTYSIDLNKLNENLSDLNEIRLKHLNDKNSLLNKNKNDSINYFSEQRILFKFEEYNPSFLYQLNKFDDKNKEIYFKVLFSLNNNFDLNFNNKNNIEEIKKEIEFRKLIDLLINDVNNFNSNSNNLQFIKEILKNKNYRNKFLLSINKYRGQSKLFQNEVSFNIFCNLFNFILDNFEINEIDECDDIVYIILLSQSFFKIDGNNKKIYLEENLKHNKLLCDLTFWERFTVKEINNDLKECGNMNYDQVVFLKIVSNIKNYCFYIEIYEDVKKIIDFLIDKFKINQKDTNDILIELKREFKNILV